VAGIVVGGIGSAVFVTMLTRFKGPGETRSEISRQRSSEISGRSKGESPVQENVASPSAAKNKGSSARDPSQPTAVAKKEIEPNSVKPDVEIEKTIEAFWGEYAAGMLKGDLAYKDKTLRLSGVTGKLVKRPDGKYVIAAHYARSPKPADGGFRIVSPDEAARQVYGGVGRAFTIPAFILFIDEEDLNSFAVLATDKPFTVVGTCTGAQSDESGVPEFFVVFKHCKLIGADLAKSAPQESRNAIGPVQRNEEATEKLKHFTPEQIARELFRDWNIRDKYKRTGNQYADEEARKEADRKWKEKWLEHDVVIRTKLREIRQTNQGPLAVGVGATFEEGPRRPPDRYSVEMTFRFVGADQDKVKKLPTGKEVTFRGRLVYWQMGMSASDYRLYLEDCRLVTSP
jgi:hypothetical protein